MTMQMVRTHKKFIAICATLTAGMSNSARADVQDFTDGQRPLWFEGVAALGDYDTIDFTGFANSTFLTDQYQSQFGVVFTDGLDIVRFNPGIYPLDDWGLDGFETTTIEFDTPQNWFAVDDPDHVQIRLYRDGNLFHTSPVSSFGFNGVISDLGFDKVIIHDPTDSNVNIDNMYFGALPAPSTAAIFLTSIFFNTKRRRR